MTQGHSRIRWYTVLLAACWVVFLVGTAIATPKFSRMFREIGGGAALPTLTSILLGVPPALWIVLGLLAGAGLIVKSKLMSRRASGIVDAISFLALVAAGAAEVIALFLPLHVPISPVGP